jgi:hypothetical protein
LLMESIVQMDKDFDPNKVIDELLSKDETDAGDIEAAVQHRSLARAAVAAAGSVFSAAHAASSPAPDDLKVETAYKFFKLRSPRY